MAAGTDGDGRSLTALERLRQYSGHISSSRSVFDLGCEPDTLDDLNAWASDEERSILPGRNITTLELRPMIKEAPKGVHQRSERVRKPATAPSAQLFNPKVTTPDLTIADKKATQAPTRGPRAAALARPVHRQSVVNGSTGQVQRPVSAPSSRQAASPGRGHASRARQEGAIHPVHDQPTDGRQPWAPVKSFMRPRPHAMPSSSSAPREDQRQQGKVAQAGTSGKTSALGLLATGPEPVAVKHVPARGAFQGLDNEGKPGRRKNPLQAAPERLCDDEPAVLATSWQEEIRAVFNRVLAQGQGREGADARGQGEARRPAQEQVPSRPTVLQAGQPRGQREAQPQGLPDSVEGEGPGKDVKGFVTAAPASRGQRRGAGDSDVDDEPVRAARSGDDVPRSAHAPPMDGDGGGKDNLRHREMQLQQEMRQLEARQRELSRANEELRLVRESQVCMAAMEGAMAAELEQRVAQLLHAKNSRANACTALRISVLQSIASLEAMLKDVEGRMSALEGQFDATLAALHDEYEEQLRERKRAGELELQRRLEQLRQRT